MSLWTEILDGVAQNAKLMREFGERGVEMDRSVLDALTAPPPPRRAAPPPMQPAPEGTPLACATCPLLRTRKRQIPGCGNKDHPKVLFLEWIPSEECERTGDPWSGEEGELLAKMAEAIGQGKEVCWHTYFCKCRPPEGRDPTGHETSACMRLLKKEIEEVSPKIIVAVGTKAAGRLLDSQQGVPRLVHQWSSYNGIPVMPISGPEHILRMKLLGRDERRPDWNALKKVMERLNNAR